MARVNPYAPEIVRVRVMSLLLIAALAGLCVALWEMQVGDGVQYRETIELQSIRRVAMPGMRGFVFDRNGACLADNAPDYCIAVYPEELMREGAGRTIDKVESLLDEISRIIGRPRELARNEISIHLSRRKPLPLLAWTGVNDTDIARLFEVPERLHGVDVYVRPERRYPHGVTAAHLLGYVGRSDPDIGDGKRYHFYLPDMIGRRGLERKFDDLLKGVPGGALVRVDVSGYKFEEISVHEPTAGGDIRLALDLEIQKIAEDAISDAVGAVVILDPRNGDVLAIASSPSFDPNAFSPVLLSSLWNTLITDEDKPLIFRAANGVYPPGSMFKPIVALGAAADGRLDRNTTVNCLGSVEVGSRKFSCYRGTAHGRLDLESAIKVSCNVFFYQLALNSGYQPVLDMASGFGLGEPTGIELDQESAGFLPSNEWKRRNHGDIWRDGDTCNLSIGQGFLLVTPLQMAVVAATIANGGTVFSPRLVVAAREKNSSDFTPLPPRVKGRIKCPDDSLDMVREGMRQAVQLPRGTGRLAAIPEVQMAGKTGTAQYGPNREKNHAWMMLFAPFDEPRYALAMVIEDGVSGGSTAAPRVARIMTALFHQETGRAD